MTKAEFLSRVRFLLGNRTDLSSDIYVAADAVQRGYEKAPVLPWFLEKQATSFATVAATRTISLPSDFRREIEELSLWIVDTTSSTQPYRRIRKGFPAHIRHQEGDELETTDVPQFYELVGNTMMFHPIPDAAYTLEWWYFGEDSTIASLADGGTNNWLTYYPELMVAATVDDLSLGLQWKTALVTKADRNRKAEERTYWIDVEARKNTNRRYQLGYAG